MAPHPKLPNAECFNDEHPKGNRLMEHVATRPRRGRPPGLDESFDHVAVFKCTECERVTTEAIEPNVH